MSEKRKSGTLLAKIKNLFAHREPDKVITQGALQMPNVGNQRELCTFKSLTLRPSEIHGIPQQTFDIALSEMIEAGLLLSKRRRITAYSR